MFQPYPHAAGTIFRIMRKPFPLPAETYSAVCGKRSRCMPAETYSAVCGKRSRTLRILCPHIAASAVCGNRFHWLRSLSRGMRELFPQAADTIPAVCGSAAECTSWPPYLSHRSSDCKVCRPNAWFPDRSNCLQSERVVSRLIR